MISARWDKWDVIIDMTYSTNQQSKAMDTPIDQISFRPISQKDQHFLCELYGTTRADEMAMVPWSEEQKQEFIDMQFNAQHTFYQEQFKDANYNIVVLNNEAIGRLYTDIRDDEIRIIDIALLPKFRGRGLGFELLNGVIEEAKQRKLPITIHVEKNNPAMTLYQRLGFVTIEDQGVYDLMRWQMA